MKFEARICSPGSGHDKKLKTFPEVKSLASGNLYRIFNRYCQQKGYTEKVMDSDSFGGLSWGTPEDISTVIALHRIN